MSEHAFEVVVIGGDADALVAAHTLARAGKRVCVIREHAAKPMHTGWVPAGIVRDLGLEQKGYGIERAVAWASAPLPDGGWLDLTHDVPATAESIRHVSERDAAKWPEFCRRVHAAASVLETIYAAPPPDPLTHDLGGYLELGRVALRVRKLEREGIEDLFRIIPMPIADLLDDWFETDALKAVLAGAGITNLARGPRSGGTAYNFLHHHVGSPPGVFRQPLSNAESVLAALTGVDTREGCVRRIDVKGGRACGIVLESGEEIACKTLVSARDPKHTLLELVDPAWLDPAFVRALGNVRSRGVAAELTLTLERAPDFSNLVLAGAVDALERAYDHYKYGRASEEPYIEARHIAASGGERDRLSVRVQYLPYEPRDGTWDTARVQQLALRIVQRLDEAAPGIAAAVVEWHMKTPLDLENIYGYPQGQPYHAEIALDQWLWMRPVPALARYRTPIEGLYLCGPAMHPGGGIVGAAGANAAGVVLSDLKTKTS